MTPTLLEQRAAVLFAAAAKRRALAARSRKARRKARHYEHLAARLVREARRSNHH